MSRSFEKSKQTWSALVHNKDITSTEVLDAYKDWAKSYEPDLLALHPDSKCDVESAVRRGRYSSGYLLQDSAYVVSHP